MVATYRKVPAEKSIALPEKLENIAELPLD